MSLKETYLANVRNVLKENPKAICIEVTRSQNNVLSPSWDLLNSYLYRGLDWSGYITRFQKEMQKPACLEEMKRIKLLAEQKDVYLVCFEKIGHCHRFLLHDMITNMEA